MLISTSNLLIKGTNEYFEKTNKELAILQNINAFPVQRNSGIDGFLKEHCDGTRKIKIIPQLFKSTAKLSYTRAFCGSLKDDTTTSKRTDKN